MDRTVSLTEARRRLAELIQQVLEGELVIIEHAGKPYAVMLSIAEYERLRQAIQPHPVTWRETLDHIVQVGAKIKARRGGFPLTAPEEIIRQVREERGAQLTGLY